MSNAFADAGKLRQELDYVWKMHDALKRELSAAKDEAERLRAALEPFLKALENSGAATRKEEGDG